MAARDIDITASSGVTVQLDKLEPEVAEAAGTSLPVEAVLAYSTAVSAKRSADALEKIVKLLERTAA